MTPLRIIRQKVFRPDSARVIIRPYIPSDQRLIMSIIGRALALAEEEAEHQLEIVRTEFASRHFDVKVVLLEHFERVRGYIAAENPISHVREQLIGALFSGEYALESAALFNPSMVAHPDQSGLPAGALRFIMSLRATGEGHISSIEFRSGVVDAQGHVTTDSVSPFVAVPAVVRNPGSNYELHFDPNLAVSERVIFPVSPDESNGIEDARFVQFHQANGSNMYYATYTAYNGRRILPQFIETRDFVNFRMMTLTGTAVQNKGMALFPRRIGDKFAMISRQDDENLYLMYSDDLNHWDSLQIFRRPVEPWEMVKIGNCGSPIETAAGWLVITHGVGPMRKYCLGALLLDITDPSKVIGSLREPLLKPEGSEREGYVPNVIYSCGSLLHGDMLVLAYATSDIASVIATLDVRELLTKLQER
jgi:predicted GH43/DUF377 family glycosyl hydrolase